MNRRFLNLAIVFAFLAGCNGFSSTPSTVPQSMTAGATVAGNANARQNPDSDPNEMPVPPVVNSVNGIARVDLSVAVNPATSFPAFDYQGVQGVAPTIRINPGDTIVMNVDNQIVGVKGMGADVNVHFHGLVVSPNAPGDDVLTMLATPGQKLHYIVHVPKYQEPGLYWYHPHVHGFVNYQVGFGGMSGALIVNGLEHHVPQIANMKDRLIIVRSTGLGKLIPPNDDMADMDSNPSGAEASDSVKPDMPQPGQNHAPCGPDTGTTTTLNGALHPDLTIKPGEQQFFRVVNAAGHKTLKLSIDGEQLQLVALDGYALDSFPGSQPIQTVPYIIVPAAGRAEFIVTGPTSGLAKFRTQCYDTGPHGDPDPALILGTLRAPLHSDPNAAPMRPMRLTVGAALPHNVYSDALPAPVQSRRVVLSENSKPHFFINGVSFRPNAKPMFTVKVGTTEVWRIVNTTNEIHDFHIHQIHFMVEDVNGVKTTQPHWQDSFIVPHKNKHGRAGYIDAYMDFRDPNIKGMFVFHCHIVDHEDAGMMAKIEAI
jgi:suppressor of ftsI